MFLVGVVGELLRWGKDQNGRQGRFSQCGKIHVISSVQSSNKYTLVFSRLLPLERIKVTSTWL